uniref:TatD related DNase n=1 Tax=Tetradesmus obliquus TaxID=3088 RepID=A0A383WPV6_TETOB|eukprot:jgi/Sobl393_1/6397/SZX79498.1
MIIDCHSHFYTPQFSRADIPGLAAAARHAGVQAIVTVPESLQDCEAVLQLAREEPIVQACAGLHPVQPIHADGQFYSSCRSVQDVSEVSPVLAFIRKHASELVAVGEVGLDFSPHVVGKVHSEEEQRLRDVQREVFKQQIQLANELGLPVNVHSRSAGHYAIDTLIECNAGGALLHAFDGKLGHALRGAAAGFYFSVPPSIVRSPQKQKLVKGLPLDRLVLETDAPALGPDKGSVNVPANITVSCAEVAKIKGVSAEEVAAVTTNNALTLFPKLQQRLATVAAAAAAKGAACEAPDAEATAAS